MLPGRSKDWASGRALSRAIVEKVLGGLGVQCDHIGFAACFFHLMERPEFFRGGFQPGLHLAPCDAGMAVRIFFKAFPEGPEQFFALFAGQPFRHGYHATPRRAFLHLRARRKQKPAREEKFLLWLAC